ncbi:MAG TPA: hypothetical protein VGK32_00060 [Vicinamibacterales bacterium]|jgi:hypothetical protein
MALDLTVVRSGERALNFWTTFQTAGTENLGSKVSVGGAGYIIGLGYRGRLRDDIKVSAGLVHLSSHLTRDLDQKTNEQRRAGAPIPVVDDPGEYNVPYIEASRRFLKWPFTPELTAIIEPVNLRLDGGVRGHVRPLYLASQWILWRRNGRSFVAETRHEIGPNPFNTFDLSFEWFARQPSEGRFQVLLRIVPGHSFHVSPNLGGVRDGIAIGIRLRFRSVRS